MKTNYRTTDTACKRLAEEWIKLGSTIHTAVIMAVLIAPILVFARQLFSPSSQGGKELLNIAMQNSGGLVLAASALLIAAFVGRYFQNKGLAILSEFEVNEL